MQAGAVDGVVTVYILGDIDGTNYEQADGTGNPYAFTYLPIASDTIYIRFRVLGTDYSAFRVHLQNECGQTTTTTMKFRQATMPVAS